MTPAHDGARNLLLNCADIRPGDRLLVLHEDPELGWYDAAAPRLVAEVARDLGAVVELRQTGGPDNRLLDGPTTAIDDGFDCCIFFARIGDQLRFAPTRNRKRVMSYVTSIEALASDYGRVEHDAMLAVKSAIDLTLHGASSIRLTCPLGTDLLGTLDSHAVPAEDTTVRRFPAGVHSPLDASRFSGTVKLAGYLTPTGSRAYEPASLVLHQTVTAMVTAGRIVTYEGDPRSVMAITQHYQRVAKQFAIAPDVVHSWHAGIHPGCPATVDAADDPDRWSNTVFTNPRFAHLHTCGDYAPGEICWMVQDPTITVDGANLWDRGKIQLAQFPATRVSLARFPVLSALFPNSGDRAG